ncbi:MAG: hypothetical protein ABSD49_13810 [Candidatus Bathyarchaeia archaeon]
MAKVGEDESQRSTLLSRLRQVRAKRIILAAAVVVVIALVVTNGFIDFPQETTQIFVFERSKAQTPSEASDWNWKLPDQLKLTESETYSVNIRVINRSTDLVRWLIYRKSAMLIEVSVWAKCVSAFPGLAVMILDSDGLIRGYRFLDLSYFGDARMLSTSYGCYGQSEFRSVVDLTYNVPSDMKSMKIWALFYGGGVQYPTQYNYPIMSNGVYGAVEPPYNLQANDNIDYSYQSFSDLQFQIVWQFFTVVGIIGLAFDLFAVRRIPKADPLYPLLVYILLFMIGLAGLLWSLSR